MPRARGWMGGRAGRWGKERLKRQEGVSYTTQKLRQLAEYVEQQGEAVHTGRQLVLHAHTPARADWTGSRSVLAVATGTGSPRLTAYKGGLGCVVLPRCGGVRR